MPTPKSPARTGARSRPPCTASTRTPTPLPLVRFDINAAARASRQYTVLHRDMLTAIRIVFPNGTRKPAVANPTIPRPLVQDIRSRCNHLLASAGINYRVPK